MGCSITNPVQIEQIEALCRAAGVTLPPFANVASPNLAESGPAHGEEPVNHAAKSASPISESAFLSAVLSLAKANGWRTAHFRPGMNRRGKWETAVQGDGVGWPDLVMVRERLVVAELKAGRNKTTDAQDAWLAAFREAGIEAYTWWPKDWATIDKVLA